MEELSGQKLPWQIADFYREANGFTLFSDTFGMYGMTRRRGTAVTQRADSVPYDIVIANGRERPKGLAPDKIVIGYYTVKPYRIYCDASAKLGLCSANDGTKEIASWLTFQNG
jgi:hypothetical protein